ncbi:hypothetical protein ACNKHP_21370 [Shigella boydii]
MRRSQPGALIKRRTGAGANAGGIVQHGRVKTSPANGQRHGANGLPAWRRRHALAFARRLASTFAEKGDCCRSITPVNRMKKGYHHA